MASTNKTAKLGLNQWVLSDPFLMEDMNADNLKIDTAIGSLSYVKVMDVTTFANASQIDMDVSEIDLSKYAMLKIFVNAEIPINTSTYLYARINNGGAYMKEIGSSTLSGQQNVGYIVTSNVAGIYNSMNLEITALPKVLTNAYIIDIKNSGCCNRNNTDYYVVDQHAVKQMAANEKIRVISFLPDSGSAVIKAGSRFVIYGVRL